MGEAYEVVAHSITVDAKGFNHLGDASDGRHWHAGSLIEIAYEPDAASLLQLGAIKASSPKAVEMTATETPSEPQADPPAVTPVKSKK
jgi:hypothetical protein